MYKMIINFVGILLLAGCATSGNYQQIVNQWQGKPAQRLLAVWGSPDASVKLPSGNTVYLYMKQQLYTTPNYNAPVAPVFSVDNGAPRYGVGFNNTYNNTQTTTLSCRTWFEVNPKGSIINAQFQGNGCVASSSGRLKP